MDPESDRQKFYDGLIFLLCALILSVIFYKC